MRREFVFLLGGCVYDFYVGRMCISHVVGYDNASSRTGFQAVLIFLVFVVLIMIFCVRLIETAPFFSLSFIIAYSNRKGCPHIQHEALSKSHVIEGGRGNSPGFFDTYVSKKKEKPAS